MCNHKQNNKTTSISQNSIRIVTWNVRGIMSSAASLSNLLDEENIDFAFITEHKLFDHSKYFLRSLNTKYDEITACNQDFNIHGTLRCGKGGVSIIYKKSLEFSVRNMNEVADERIIGVEIYCDNNVRIYAFCVYMPSVNYSDESYSECLNNIQSICDSYSENGILFCLLEI